MPFELPCVPILRTSCSCGCSIRAGSIFLGWFQMFGYMALLVWNALTIANFDDLHIPRHYYDGVKGIYMAVLVIYFIGTLFNGLLLCGIHCEQPSIMIPHLMYSLFLFVFTLMGILYYGISILAHDNVTGFTIIFVGPLFYVIIAYFWIVIYSHYQELEKKFSPKVQYEKCYAEPTFYSTKP